MKKRALSLLVVGTYAIASALPVFAQQRPLTPSLLGVTSIGQKIQLAAPAPSTATFYRGFELTTTIQPDEMGYAPTNALLMSGKKRVIKTDFMNLAADLGGFRQAFAPRDPVNKSIVYLGTNHTIREEGGQTGVFIAWKYNVDNGSFSRLYSLKYGLEEAPEGYDIIGNEGTKLVVLKNIDGPHCTRDIPGFSSSLQAIDMRSPAKGLGPYAPSASMIRVFGALPPCFEEPQEPTLSLSASNNNITVGQTNAATLTATFSASQLPPNSHIEIQRVFAGHSATLIATCVTSSCRGVIHGDESVGTRTYMAYVLDEAGEVLYRSEGLTIQVHPASVR